jgi:hypothetical protein
MKYLKYFKSINEGKGLSKRSYVYDINDILQDLDMVDIPQEYKQEIEFNVSDSLDEDRILRIEISGSENKLIPMSIVDETLERLKSYLETIGCKLAIKYYDGSYRIGRWSDTKPRLTKKILLGIRLNLYKTLQARYNKSNYYMLLNDDNTIVVLDNEMSQGNRTYYITFKKVDSSNRYSTFKFQYMANSRNFINFTIHDNHGNPVEWSKLSSVLHSVGVDYGIFNNGWSYMENDFNEQGYTSTKTKKFFDI